jgi:hypothetical protein
VCVFISDRSLNLDFFFVLQQLHFSQDPCAGGVSAVSKTRVNDLGLVGLCAEQASIS